MTSVVRVGVIAAELEEEATGVGRFLTGLLEGVRSLPLDWEWRLFFQGRRFDHPLFADPRLVPVFSARTGSRVLWEQLRLPFELPRHQLDLLYSPAYSLPEGRLPGVVSLHDLSFEVLPEEYSLRERWRRRLLARRAARRAVRVLVDSASVRREVAATYRLDPDRVGVVPVAVDPRFRPAVGKEATADLALLAAHGVQPPFLLQAGTVFERRRLPLVVEAFAALAAERPELALVVAGAIRLRDPGQLSAAVARAGLGERVKLLGWVDDRLLLALYRQAALTFYLSTYEGFGIPPLESLACNVPAVTSPGLGLDELWPDYPYRCAALNRDTVAATARSALQDDGGRAATLVRGRELVAGRTLAAAAGALVAELERALRR